MSKINKSTESTRRATTLSVYKRLIEEGKLRIGGAGEIRYNNLLKMRIRL